MNYEETLTYLFNSTPVFEHVGASAYKEGLDNSLALDRHLGHPHQQFRSVHIATPTTHTPPSMLPAPTARDRQLTHWPRFYRRAAIV